MNDKKSEEKEGKRGKRKDKSFDKSFAVGLAIAAILSIFLGWVLFGENTLNTIIPVSIGLLIVAVVVALKGNRSTK